MSTLRYAVVQVAEEWRVISSRRQLGRFPSRDQAIELGAGFAREALASGHHVELVVQGGCGELVVQDFAPVHESAS